MNPSVTSSLTGNSVKTHRLVGELEFYGEIINSYALDNMLLNGQIVTEGSESNQNDLSKSVEELQQQMTYETGLSWDFTNIWKIREGHGYPYFQSSEYLTSIISADSNNANWGTLLPKGVVAVKDGSSKIFEIAPSSGYEIESVLVDNVSVGTPSTYTFSNIMENHTIIAIFKEKSLNTNELAAKSISIYPSPTSNNIYVTGNKKISAPELYNNNGQKVLQGSGNSMDLTKITNGVYILKIITDNGEISTSKIIKR